eukprot:1157960-Pelagomonas_calceolata.AAC.1
MSGNVRQSKTQCDKCDKNTLQTYGHLLPGTMLSGQHILEKGSNRHHFVEPFAQGKNVRLRPTVHMSGQGGSIVCSHQETLLPELQKHH